MERTCTPARQIGLSTLIFTEHLDCSGWMAAPEDFGEQERRLIDADGVMQPPKVDVQGYFTSIERCRHLFPELRILTGVEFGQPHLGGEAAAQLLNLSTLDRELDDPADVIWTYLAEIPAMVDGGDFEVFTHIDYAARYWPVEESGPFDVGEFEDGFRQAMQVIAASGRALEMNTGRPVRPWIPLR